MGTTQKDSTEVHKINTLEEEEENILIGDDEVMSWDGLNQNFFHNTSTLELELLGPLQRRNFRSSDEIMEEQAPMSDKEFEEIISKLSYLIEVPSEDEELLELEAALPSWASQNTQDISASL
ncbi:hypothetical protein Pmani_000097 [Petrolisthes manimaculis]|uniref:Uncharacterized protein n=1 Tax=Petrolisthes manimaculis TaxID=1843537 RepID=A0AAE1QPT3_9EUCA|nr:hypothetical protein Pmani_014698 [Petrolisthes manimaculis]KAK4329548.1 hypothetical protein Pmani_000097 [Petrolisthes manimaculis]